MSNIKLRSTTSWLSILATQGVICAGAAAAPITVTETINFGSVNPGGSLNGTFDINSLLQAAGGNYTAPLQLLSAYVAIYGYSAPSASTVYGAYSGYQQTGGYNYYYYVQGPTYYYTYYNWYNCWYGCQQANYYYYQVTAYVINETNYATNTVLDPLDSATLTTGGGTSVSAQDTESVTDQGSYNYYNYTYYYYNYNYGTNSQVNLYSQVDTIDDISNGSLSALTALSTNDLSLLSQAGTLGWTLGMNSGDLTSGNIQLSVTLNQSPSVPEPGTLSIFGFSLLLIALRARSVKKPNLDS